MVADGIQIFILLLSVIIDVAFWNNSDNLVGGNALKDGREVSLGGSIFLTILNFFAYIVIAIWFLRVQYTFQLELMPTAEKDLSMS